MSAKHFLGGAALGAGLVYVLDSGGPKAISRYGARLGDIEGLEAADLGRGRASANTRGLARLKTLLETVVGSDRGSAGVGSEEDE